MEGSEGSRHREVVVIEDDYPERVPSDEYSDEEEEWTKGKTKEEIRRDARYEFLIKLPGKKRGEPWSPERRVGKVHDDKAQKPFKFTRENLKNTDYERYSRDKSRPEERFHPYIKKKR